MKGLFTLLLLTLLTGRANAQSNVSATDFYAQSLVYLSSDAEYQQLSSQLAAIPYVRNVRIDKNSHQLFVSTKDLSSFDESVLQSWLGNYSAGVSCVHTGIFGITPFKSYINGECPSN